MPLYKTIAVSKAITAHIWKVTETEDALAQNVVLTPNCQNRMLGMKSAMHRRAFLSIRHLMRLEGFEDKDLTYDSNGKPHLVNGHHISITHSHNFTAIIISTAHEVGIDIEKQRPKILRIAHKFTPIEEYYTLANTEAIIRKLTIVWGAKESIYKIYAQPGLSFLQHIDVKDFLFDDLKTSAIIDYKGKKSNYDIDFIEFEGFTCVYALKNKE
ncbi:MAG: 4'-phosphopantetheinyl transferase superfamily protein [Croceitalea sp.]|nr:4'-phosphopantetheinyl transferase superfamily protein [Croceitalea sp.]MBT8238951.1 4'-phosphopantetheinyl transferase superfamily protein [Croceitalea sp.]NNC35515.1 4'-phosphopantetheinyl transferase superfamily protein [Croceitalea sp.]NNL08959.1 4'-phosphopantetheinyl transferase superfamily protein [Croceitalea sp.]NNM18051.1 4'-phosphopantetheinyl transferase superfamily protein [Croceitalea sp.]